MPALEADQWVITHLNTIKRTFSWTIKNYSYNLSKKPGSVLESSPFSIDNHDFTLQLYIKGNSNFQHEFTHIYFCYKCSADDIQPEGWYSVSILNGKNEKSIEFSTNIIKHDMKLGHRSFVGILQHDELIDKVNNLLANDSLQLFCELTILREQENKIGNNLKIAISPKSNDDKCIYFEKIYTDSRFHDVKLVTPCGRILEAHKNVLAARSAVFSAMFDHDFLENKTNVVDIPDIEYAILQEMLRYIYTNRVKNFENLAGELLLASDKYQIDDLKEKCAEVLCENITIENAIDTLHLADKFNVDRLKDKVINFIKLHFKEIMNLDSYKFAVAFKSLQKKPDNQPSTSLAASLLVSFIRQKFFDHYHCIEILGIVICIVAIFIKAIFF